MVIKKITLRNFGPFLGEHSLDLSTTPNKPLILVGALNGGGKTTILEATRLTSTEASAETANSVA